MKLFLDTYSLDQACDDIAMLEIYSNDQDKHLFADAMTKYLSRELRKEYGIDLLAVVTRGEIRSFVSAMLSAHSGMNTDMAFIATATGIRINLREMGKLPHKKNAPDAD